MDPIHYECEDYLRLPALVNSFNRFKASVLLGSLITGLYFLTNHFTLFEPVKLELLEFEKNLPLMPWTIWIYLTLYVFMAGVFAQIETVYLFNRMAWALLSVQAVSVLCFTFMPISYPRELFAVDPSQGFSSWAMGIMFTVDRSTNCLPSLHVSNTTLLIFTFLHEKRERFWPHLIWGSLIILSTLTTKQHYFYDLATGVLLGVSAYLVFFKTRFFEIDEQFDSSTLSFSSEEGDDEDQDLDQVS